MKKLICLVALIGCLFAPTVLAETVGDYSFDVPNGFELTSDSTDASKKYNNEADSTAIAVAVSSNVFTDPLQWDTVANNIVEYKTKNFPSGLLLDSFDTTICDSPGKITYSIVGNDSGLITYYALGFFYDAETKDVYTIELIHTIPKPFNSTNDINAFTDLINSIKRTTEEKISEESTDGVSPELVEQTEAYKEFFKEYVNFMKDASNLDSSNSLSFLSDYSEFIEKYEDAMNALDKMDSENMSEADRKYYTNTMLEIDQLLLEGLKQ